MPLGSCRPLRDIYRQLPLAEGGGITAPDFPVTCSRWLKMSSGVEKALETSSVLTVSHQQRAAKSKSKSKTTDRNPGSAGNADGESPPPLHRVNGARCSAVVTRYNRCCSEKVNNSFFFLPPSPHPQTRFPRYIIRVWLSVNIVKVLVWPFEVNL